MRKKIITAIDDSPVLLTTLQGILAERFEFRGFSGVDRALRYLNSHVVDLIILDIRMPMMDGHQLLAAIREIPDLKEVPVLMLTSSTSVTDIRKAVSEGASDYILKPVDTEILEKKIASLIGE
ncbi:MAG: response regulator [Clostridia bacterium]|nr:response regulator [Clostridia bacterium]